MKTPTRLRLTLAVFCVCVFVRPTWAQHASSGGHGGGSFGFHGGGSPSFASRPTFRPSAPSPAPRPFYGSSRGPFAPFSFRGPTHFVRPGAGYRYFRSSSARSAVAQGRVPRSAYLAGRNPRYTSQAGPRGPSGRSISGSRGAQRTASNRPATTPLQRHAPVYPSRVVSHNPFFRSVFFHHRPFFYWPFYYPTFTWWYPPLTFSDNYPAQGCPYDDYYYQQQRQPSYQPEEQEGAAEQPAESAEEAASVPPAQPQEQTAPFTYETPLPDVIEWGTPGKAVPEKQPAPGGKGPLVVNFPHHTLTILLNEPSSLRAPAP
jgi:hypothetical protein